MKREVTLVQYDLDSVIYIWTYEKIAYRRYNSVGRLIYIHEEPSGTHRYRLEPFVGADWQSIVDRDSNAYSWDYTHWIDRPGGPLRLESTEA